jgi:hypothetical protein
MRQLRDRPEHHRQLSDFNTAAGEKINADNCLPASARSECHPLW